MIHALWQDTRFAARAILVPQHFEILGLDPTDKNECKNGGWEAFGFRNQGQCVRFVETGQDSR